MMRFFFHQPETSLLINPKCRQQNALGPQLYFPVTGGPGEPDALIHQGAGDTFAPGASLHQQQAELGYFTIMPVPHKKECPTL